MLSLSTFQHLKCCLSGRPEHHPDLTVGTSAPTHLSGSLGVYLPKVMELPCGFSTGRDTVIGIPLYRGPLQVFRTIVRAIRIEMVNYVAVLRFTKEGPGNQTVDSRSNNNPAMPEGNLPIPLNISMGQRALSVTDVAFVANLKGMSEARNRNWFPYLVFHDNCLLTFMRRF